MNGQGLHVFNARAFIVDAFEQLGGVAVVALEELDPRLEELRVTGVGIVAHQFFGELLRRLHLPVIDQALADDE